MAELKMHDEEFTQAEDTYAPLAKSMDGYLSEYLSILKGLVAHKTVEGKTADSILRFANLAEKLLAGELSATLGAHGAKTGAFVEAMETEDDTVW